MQCDCYSVLSGSNYGSKHNEVLTERRIFTLTTGGPDWLVATFGGIVIHIDGYTELDKNLNYNFSRLLINVRRTLESVEDRGCLKKDWQKHDGKKGGGGVF